MLELLRHNEKSKRVRFFYYVKNGVNKGLVNDKSKSMKLADFDYNLPEERIAMYPLADRNRARLLQFKDGLSHHVVSDAPGLLPSGAMVVFNDTRVAPARLLMKKDTGATVEILLTGPVAPYKDMQQAMSAPSPVVWKCMIGNLKKWKEGQILALENSHLGIKARLVDRDEMLVEFAWQGEETFSEIVEKAGHMPLPPYINRKDEALDVERYQTVYSKNKGAVAAPTAGLHFSNEDLERMKANGIKCEYLTLHVSSGTFLPVKHEEVYKHPMHSEQIYITKETVRSLAEHEGAMAAVGTTSLRTLESMYWHGVKVLREGGHLPFLISKTDPKELTNSSMPDFTEAMAAIYDSLEGEGLEALTGSTGIYILPGYEFRSVDALFTNFHLPKSTLIMLVSAFTGNRWREIYETALDKGYRFLSYGDTSLLWR